MNFFSHPICEGKIRKIKNLYQNIVQVKAIHWKIPFPVTCLALIYETLYKKSS